MAASEAHEHGGNEHGHEHGHSGGHGHQEGPEHEAEAGVTPIDFIWLSETWPFVRGQLPPALARVVELGCGTSGGHVPALIQAGYHATGVDPAAPDEPDYQRTTFEEYQGSGPADAVVASLSLHHVTDPGAALDHVAEVLRPGGVLVVLEMISEDFDEATAQWCFRHEPRGEDEPKAWLSRMRAEWAESGLSWEAYFQGWRAEYGLHPASAIRRELAARFTTSQLSTGPYFFPQLRGADAVSEQAAIDAGELRAGCLRYAGRWLPIG